MSERGRDTAIYCEALACYERGCVAGKEDHRAGDLFRAPPSTQCGATSEPARPLWVFSELGIGLRGKCSRCNRVDGYSIAAKIGSECAGKAVDSCLGGCIAHVADPTEAPDHRGNINDSTLCSPPNQITGNRLTDRICGNQVAVEHAPELNRRHLVDPATVALADIVDEHIDVSKRRNCQPRRFLLRNIK